LLGPVIARAGAVHDSCDEFPGLSWVFGGPWGNKAVDVTSGADMTRQSPAAGQVDELTIIVAPIVLGAGGSSC